MMKKLLIICLVICLFTPLVFSVGVMGHANAWEHDQIAANKDITDAKAIKVVDAKKAEVDKAITAAETAMSEIEKAQANDKPAKATEAKKLAAELKN